MTILVIEDDQTLADTLVLWMNSSGFQANAAYTGFEGLSTIKTEHPDLILCDLNLPDISGLDLLPQLLEQAPNTKVIIMTGGGCTADAVNALKLGADDYLEKPLELKKILLLLQKMGQKSVVTTPQKNPDNGIRQALGHLGIHLGTGMTSAYEDLSTAATQNNIPVLLWGETGSGKEHAARLFHQLSRYSAGPFVELNCAALPEGLEDSELFGAEAGAYTDSKRRHVGLFEAAQGGTLFLDEVSELSLATQAKLLKVMENREIRRVGSHAAIQLDLRLVAATNKDLRNEVQSQRFRADLFYRLSLFAVRLPPLRERRKDIPELAAFLFNRACLDFGIHLSPLCQAQLTALAAQDWPGNVRELRNFIESAVLRSRNGCPDMRRFPTQASRSQGHERYVTPSTSEQRQFQLRPLREAVSEAVRKVKLDLLECALRQCNGNKTQAAKILQIDVKTIQNLQKSLGFDN
jgi:two-component system response regulator AtoC